MDHLQLSLRTPKQSPRGTPVEGTEGNGSTSASNCLLLVPGSPLSAFALAPKRNYEQELETRTMNIPPMDPMTNKKLEFPQLGFESRSSSPEEDDGTIPTFSLKRKRCHQDQDIVVAPSSSRLSSSKNKMGQDRMLFRPIVSPSDES